jgi:uncharacterized repeat protein (TIGR01451 family)
VNKLSKIIIRFSLGVAALLFVSAGSVFASGTPAGTVISSRVKVTYTDVAGLTADSAFSNFVSITIAQVAAVNVTPPNGAVTTSSDSVNVDYPLTVTNSGNGTDKFTLSKLSSKGWTVLFYKDANGNGLLDAPELTAGAITATDSVKEDSTFKVIARVLVPRNSALNNQIDTTTAAATSQFNNSKSAAEVLLTTVHTVNFSNIGNGLTVDNQTPAPGQNVTFTFTLTNNGSVPATGVNLSDLLSGFTFVSATTSQGSFNSTGNPVLWNIGTVNAGGSVTVTITLNVPLSTTSGTVLNNVFSATYSSGANTFIVSSNSRSITVGTAYSVSISPDSVASSREPQDSVKYYFTVKNTGALKDVIELSTASSEPITWKFIRDVNNNHIIDAADVPLTNTNGKAGVDVDSVASGDSVHVFALAILPMVPLDQTKDVTTITATSSANSSKFQSMVATTTTNIPVLTVAISVSPLPSQPQPPGGVLTYTISYANSGHADIDTSYTVTARIPDSTSYVPGSVKLGTLSLPDSAAIQNGTVSIKTAGLKQATNGTAEFKVKIK